MLTKKGNAQTTCWVRTIRARKTIDIRRHVLYTVRLQGSQLFLRFRPICTFVNVYWRGLKHALNIVCWEAYGATRADVLAPELYIGSNAVRISLYENPMARCCTAPHRMAPLNAL